LYRLYSILGDISDFSSFYGDLDFVNMAI
jgi:hypothetical protein